MNPDREKIVDVIIGWLGSCLENSAAEWVRERRVIIASGDAKGLFLAFGMTPRKVGKADLALTNAEIAVAEKTRPGWNLSGWSVDQAVRTLFVLTFPSQKTSSFVKTLDQLFGTGEVGELVALYQALPLLPHPEAHLLRAAEGIRTNIKAVFCAVAHRNPYPSEQFNDDQWNQMVLKCQFIGVPISPVVGLDLRSNPDLSTMVLDFIHERRSAKRTVPAEMWRCVGRYANAQAILDLRQMLTTGTPAERQAAALALCESQNPDATSILAAAPELAAQVAAGTISWATVEALETIR